MSEPKRPFEDAIYILSRYMDNRLRGKEAAIRVLEAAGKIKDPRATELAFLTIVDEARVDEKNQFVCEIRTLIESLPEKEEK